MNCYSNLGAIYNSWGKYDMAISSYKKAIEIAKESEMKYMDASISYNLGGTYFNKKDYALAYSTGEHVEALYRSMKLPIKAMKVAGALSELYPFVFKAE